MHHNHGYPRAALMSETIVSRALAEDLGDADVPTAATVPAQTRAHAVIRQKAPGVIYGLDVAEEVFRSLDADATFTREVTEGEWRESGEVLRVDGRARALLSGERTALNFLQRLSGVATMAARAVHAIDGTGARILDTRKTTPGLRALEKGAVDAGGAGAAVRRAREEAPDLPLEVECRDLAEVDEALAAGAPTLLLDNMSPAQLREAVAHVAGRAELEASGGVTLQTLREVASTGVDFVSLGALPHSAPALDLSLLLTALP